MLPSGERCFLRRRQACSGVLDLSVKCPQAFTSAGPVQNRREPHRAVSSHNPRTRERVGASAAASARLNANTDRANIALRVGLVLGVDLGEHFADDLGRLVRGEGVAAL